ncbi:MAG TPA: T9SS type A sorting domain-containing protein, partial [Cyclobacteriaceae bacterium]
SWKADETLSTTTGNTVVANPKITTTYTVTAQRDECIFKKKVTIKVNPLPVILAEDARICLGSSTTLLATGGQSYIWSPSTGLSGNTGSSVIANPLTTTMFTVTGLDVNSCSGSKQIVVTVKTPPLKPTITSATVNFETALLISSSATGNQWYKDGNLLTGAVNQVFPAQSSGKYTVRVTFDQCLSELSDPYDFVITSLEEQNNNSMMVSPIPAINELTINLDTFIEDTGITITIIDAMGRPVINSFIKSGRDVLNIGDLNSGYYLLRAQQNSHIETIRFLKN